MEARVKERQGVGRDQLWIKGKTLFYNQRKGQENLHIEASFRFGDGKNGAI